MIDDLEMGAGHNNCQNKPLGRERQSPFVGNCAEDMK